MVLTLNILAQSEIKLFEIIYNIFWKNLYAEVLIDHDMSPINNFYKKYVP